MVNGGDSNKCNKRKCSNFQKPKISCYTYEQLVDIAKSWNQKHPNNQIQIGKISDNEEFKKNLWIKLNQKIGEINEEKWINIVGMVTKSEEMEARFAPIIDSEWKNNKNAWLSDEDINKVMKSFKNQFKGFYYLDSSPIDFDKKDDRGRCKISDLCRYNYKELADDYETFGIVFNTDPSYKSGQHWIALFIQLQKGKIFFFDSTGNDPPDEVDVLMNRLGREAEIYFKEKNKEINVELLINKQKHQQGNTECGVYCLFFIYHMLRTGDFTFNKNRITDQQIEKLRGFFYDDIFNIYPTIDQKQKNDCP